MPRMMREQRMLFERHTNLFPTAERAAALRLFAAIDHVRADGPPLAADHGRLPIEINRAGALQDHFLRVSRRPLRLRVEIFPTRRR